MDADEMGIPEHMTEGSPGFFRSLFINNDAIMLLIDPENGDIIDANNAACRYYEWSHEDLIHKKICNLNTLSQKEVVAEMTKAKNETWNHFFFKHQKSSGDIRDVEVFSAPVTIKDKKLLWSIIHDITEAKAAQSELANNKRKYRKLFENDISGIAIHRIILDQKGKPCDYIFLEANEAFEKHTGLKAKDIIGKRLTEVIPETENETFFDIFGKVALTGIPVMFEQYSKQLKRYYIISAYQIKDQIFATIFQDITENKLVEIKLREKTEELETYFASSRNLLGIANKKGKFIRMNKEWERVFGYSIEELESHSFLDFVHPDDIESTLEAIDSLDSQKTVLNFVNRRVCKDGSYRWIEWHSRLEGDLIHTVARDITERKQAEEERLQYEIELEKSREQFMLAVSGSNDGIWDWNIREKKGYMSPRLKEIIGFEDEEFPNKYTAFEEHIHPDDQKIVKTSMEEYLSGKKPNHSVEFRLRHKDGSYIWVLSKGKALIDEKGKPYRIAGSLTDITGRKRSEEKLRHYTMKLEKSQEQFMLAVKGSQDGIWDWDLPNKSLYLSERWKEIIGYKDSELPNELSTFDGRLHPDDKDRVLNYIEEYLNGGIPKYQMEFRLRHKDGTYRWILAKGEALRDEKGVPYRMAGSHTDVTERKHAEDKLKENRELLQSIINILPGVLTVVDTDYNIITLNESDSRLKRVGFTYASELEGKKCYKVFQEMDSPCPWCKINEVIDTGENAYDETGPDDIREKKTGRAYSYTVCPIKDKSGNIISVVEYGADVTELRNSKLEAENANRAKSEFLANMSHEIRTPMNGVIGMTGLLLDTELDAVQRNYVEMIRKSGETLIEVINDILDISKIEAGKLELENVDFSLYDLLEELSSLFSIKAYEKGLELTCLIENNVPDHIRGDPFKLKQVLTNLTGNALKFTNEGRVTIHVNRESGTDKSATLCFSVKDTGIGIPEDKKYLLFETFSQVDASTTRKYGGTGLGLAITKHLVEMMNGEINVRTLEEKGSDFWFRIPIEISGELSGKHVKPYDLPYKKEQELIHHKNKDLYGHGNTDDIRILIVEDNQINQRLAQALLQKLGYDPDVVTNGNEALKLLETQPYDLVFMDVQMPLMDGLETTQHIRNPDSTVIDHDIPVIAMTAHAMKGDKEQCLDAGMNDYMSKPISAEQLFILMEKWSSIILKRNTETNIRKNSPISGNTLQIFVKEKFMERMAGDYNLANEITSMFLNNIPVIIANMKKAADIDNMEEVSSYAHSIKGSSANIGGEVLSDIAAKIEKLGRSGKITEVQALIPELERQFELLTEEFKNI